jgi:hypothetical protein
MEEVLNGYVTNPNPTPTLTPNPNSNQINKKIQKETTLENGSFQKRSTLSPQRKFLPSGGGREKKLFLIIVNVLGHPKGVGGLTSYFLRRGGMDVFWNDPIDRAVCWMENSANQISPDQSAVKNLNPRQLKSTIKFE